jgi:outer membrane lipoprotein carrier protein
MPCAMLIKKESKSMIKTGSNDKHLLFLAVISLLSFLFCIFPFAGTSYALSADEEVARIQKAYENIKDISGSFIQKSYLKDLKRTDTYSGQLFIKKPQKMKVLYKGENSAEIFINNDSVVIYQKKEKQAFKSAFDGNTYGQTPIVLLSGMGKMQDEFSVTEKNGVLLLKPKKPMGTILSIEVETSDGQFPIKALTIHDSASNTITITLKDIKINTRIDDKVFEPFLPIGTAILGHNP